MPGSTRVILFRKRTKRGYTPRNLWMYFSYSLRSSRSQYNSASLRIIVKRRSVLLVQPLFTDAITRLLSRTNLESLLSKPVALLLNLSLDFVVINAFGLLDGLF